jgi:hypothetical protein
MRVRFAAILGAAAVAGAASLLAPESSYGGGKPGPGKYWKVSAEEITKEFVENKDAAQEKYAGKAVLVEGSVRKSDIGPVNKDRRISIAGYADGKSGFTKVVVCPFPKGDKAFAAASKLAAGQKVKIRGTFESAVQGNVFLSKCELVEAGKQ